MSEFMKEWEKFVKEHCIKVTASKELDEMLIKAIKAQMLINKYSKRK